MSVDFRIHVFICCAIDICRSAVLVLEYFRAVNLLIVNLCHPTSRLVKLEVRLSYVCREPYQASAGKIVLLSMGGATGNNGFSSNQQATTFADQIWNLFFGGSSSTRPFGDAILDGLDLDLEGGSQDGYPAFINRIRSYTKKANKKFVLCIRPA